MKHHINVEVSQVDPVNGARSYWTVDAGGHIIEFQDRNEFSYGDGKVRAQAFADAWNTRPAAVKSLDYVEARVMQDWQWGNLTRLGVANHLKRGGFNSRTAVAKANALPNPDLMKMEELARQVDAFVLVRTNDADLAFRVGNMIREKRLEPET